MELELYRQIFQKNANIKLYEDPSSGSRAIPCERTGRQTDKTKLIVVFRNIVNAPKRMPNHSSTKDS